MKIHVWLKAAQTGKVRGDFTKETMVMLKGGVRIYYMNKVKNHIFGREICMYESHEGKRIRYILRTARILILCKPRVPCQKKEHDISEETRSVWLKILNLIRRSVEKKIKIKTRKLKIGTDIIQLAFMTLTWSVICKTIWRSNTEKKSL